MRLRLLFIYFLTVFCSHSFAQVSDVIFIGTVAVKGGKGYSYKLLVTDSGGYLRGYSVTDLRGVNETKAAVRGKLDKTRKQLIFRETKILATKSKSLPANFCYLSGTLNVTKVQGGTALKGSFKGYKADGKTQCATGRMALFAAQNMLDKLMKAANKDSITSRKADTLAKAPKNIAIIYEKAAADLKIKTLMPGQNVELLCPSPVVFVDVWDAKTIDGDKITIEQDNVPILENFVISGKRKRIQVNMGKKEMVTLRVLAQNEGTEPMNTARLRVVCGSEDHYIDATTTMDQSVRISLKRDEPPKK